MMKYCTIKWEGKTTIRSKRSERNKIVKSLESNLLKDLLNNGISELDASLLLGEAIEKNDLSILGKEIASKYSIEDYFIDVAIDDDSIKDVVDFVTITAKEIESKEINSNSKWTNANVFQNSFYCATLCGSRAHCPHYRSYIKTLEDKEDVSPVVKSEKDILKDLGLSL